jgi:hypothetical protein
MGPGCEEKESRDGWVTAVPTSKLLRFIIFWTFSPPNKGEVEGECEQPEKSDEERDIEEDETEEMESVGVCEVLENPRF